MAIALAALADAQATARLDTDTYKATTQTDQAQVNEANQSLPSTVAAAQAAIAIDQSAIKADQTALDGAVLRSPVDAVVASVGGVVGDIASSDGVHQFSTPQALPSQPSSGITLFPSAPTQQATPTSQFASLITLNAPGIKVVAQVGESSIRKVHVGQSVHVHIPAFPGTNFLGTVSSIDPQAINDSGKVAYLVEISVNAPAATVKAVANYGKGRNAALLPGLSADVSV